jgi:hypothetical protein
MFGKIIITNKTLTETKSGKKTTSKQIKKEKKEIFIKIRKKSIKKKIILKFKLLKNH